MSEHIMYHIADGIATLTLNRPKVLNAINYDLLKELDELLDQAAADDSLRVLILTEAGKLLQREQTSPSRREWIRRKRPNGGGTAPGSSADWNVSRSRLWQ